MAKKPSPRRALTLRALETLNARLPAGERMRPGRDDHDDEHRLAGLFADLAAEPAELHALLDDVPGGRAVVRRVLRVARDAPRPKRPRLAREVIETLVRKHYAAVRRLAVELDEPELAASLPRATPIRWGKRPTLDEWHEPGVEGDVHEFLGEHFHRLEGDEPLHALHEAGYGLAASYEIARYVLWPAFAAAIRTADPYRHRAELFVEGIGTRHEGSRIRVWREPV